MKFCLCKDQGCVEITEFSQPFRLFICLECWAHRIEHYAK